LKSFIKWQVIPKPTIKKYNVVPFIATLKLIDEVNNLESARGQKAKGLSKREFSLFVPAMIDFNDIGFQILTAIKAASKVLRRLRLSSLSVY
jgi:hypothetical protein